MPKLSVTTTVTQQAKLTPALKKELLTKMQEHAKLHVVEKNAKAGKKKIAGRVEEIMEVAGETMLEVNGFKSTLIAPVKKSLNIKKLIAKGVSLDLINSCYDETPGTAYVKITAPGASDDE